MKVALLDRRMGPQGGGRGPNEWIVKKEYYKDYPKHGNGNTFSFLNTFKEVMTGALDEHSQYDILKDYDLIYMRIRGADESKHIKRLREACPDSILIGYTDEWVNFTHFKPDSWIYKISLYLDAITCGFGELYEWEAFKGMEISNYHHLPYASAVNGWRDWYKPLAERENAIAGMWHIRSIKEQGKGDKVHSATLKILKQIQDETGCKCYFFLNFDGHKALGDIQAFANNIGLDCEFLSHMPTIEFNEKMASIRVFFEEYQCPAFSRATVVSAAMGTPQVGNDMNDPSTGCFPELTSIHGDWSKNINDIRKLMTDDKYWLEQSEKGREACNYYYYPDYKKRLLALYNKLKDNKPYK